VQRAEPSAFGAAVLSAKARCSRVEAGSLRCPTGQPFVDERRARKAAVRAPHAEAPMRCMQGMPASRGARPSHGRRAPVSHEGRAPQRDRRGNGDERVVIVSCVPFAKEPDVRFREGLGVKGRNGAPRTIAVSRRARAAAMPPTPSSTSRRHFSRSTCPTRCRGQAGLRGTRQSSWGNFSGGSGRTHVGAYATQSTIARWSH
jgi:hypothetical protein